MKGGWKFLIGTAVTGFPALAFAQPNIPPAVSTAVNQTDDLQEKRTSAPSGRSDSLLSGLVGEIEINGGEPKASLSFNGKLSPEIVAAGVDGMSSNFGKPATGCRYPFHWVAKIIWSIRNYSTGFRTGRH